jgi:hypothetical protein
MLDVLVPATCGCAGACHMLGCAGACHMLDVLVPATCFDVLVPATCLDVLVPATLVLPQWVVAAVDYNATKEMFQAFDNFRLLYSLSTLGVTAATYGAGAIVESACRKNLRFQVQSGPVTLEEGVPQVRIRYCKFIIAASFTALCWTMQLPRPAAARVHT